VSERTGVVDFAKSAKGLTLGWTRRLKLDYGATRERAPQIDAETAWGFSKGRKRRIAYSWVTITDLELSTAYFEESYDAVFGVVFRPAFEARLQQHFEGGVPDDPAWYATRNIVYASGCRILSSKDPSTTFLESQQRAWKYFENAISVHTDLLITPTGLLAVQALALMVKPSLPHYLH
jgi:hypothetical protein